MRCSGAALTARLAMAAAATDGGRASLLPALGRERLHRLSMRRRSHASSKSESKTRLTSFSWVQSRLGSCSASRSHRADPGSGIGTLKEI